jgi:endonuclease/exonuclease/phosphatase family metal-dependent hydrolase
VPALVSVASLNVHGGVDGWGRPFDVVGACRRADSDILVLQECFTPEGGQGLAEEVAGSLGYQVCSVPMGRARRYPPPALADDGWGRLWPARPGVGVKALPDRRRDGAERGTLGLALLSRLPMSQPEVVDLGRWLGDAVRRLALMSQVDCDGRSLVVVGTHMSHLRNGSPLQLQRLRRCLPAAEVPAVLLGDMNLWGPPVSLSLPGWSRAVRGRSWPAWRPLFQIDHVLVSRPVGVERGEVLAPVGSDHLPVRAVLSLR